MDMEVSCLTKDEIDAALQLIQLTGTGTGYSRLNSTNNTAMDRKLEKEEEYNFIADVSSPSVIEERLRRQDGSLGGRKRKFGQSRRNQNDGNTKLAPEMNAAQQLLQLCDGSDGHDDRVEGKKEEREEELEDIASDISYLTDASSSSAMELEGRLGENEKEAEAKEEKEIRREGSDSSCVIKREGIIIIEEWEALCRKRRKLRSVVDIYRTTKPLKVDLLLIC
ncbi:hypothetical protein U1Q18_035394 [Sarracenia purpurea var. burkii]